MGSVLVARSSGGAVRAAHHAQQGGAHKGQEGHHHRHRVAGQATTAMAPPPVLALISFDSCLRLLVCALEAEMAKDLWQMRPGHGAAGAHGDAPEGHIAQLFIGGVWSASPTLPPPLVMMCGCAAAW